MNVCNNNPLLGKDDREELQIEKIVKGVPEHYQEKYYQNLGLDGKLHTLICFQHLEEEIRNLLLDNKQHKRVIYLIIID